ncbi:MAG TPA: hypothetical protein VF139_06475 [Candidatus Polarisedimenticolaceae bacterium]
MTMRRWLPLLWFASMGAPILAGTIEVKVIGPGGAGVAGATVVVDRETLRSDWMASPEARTATTGPDGVAVFPGLPAGSWKLRGELPLTLGLVSPTDAVPVTLIDDEATASVLLQGVLGDRVRVTAVGAGSAAGGARLLFQDSSGPAFPLSVDGQGRGEVVLPAGRWVVLVPGGRSAPSSVELDGRSVGPGNPIVTTGAGATIEVTWRFAATGRVAGQVRYEGPVPDSQVFVAAERKPAPGEPPPDAASTGYAEVDAGGRFSFAIREGTWRLRLGGHAILEAQPAEIEVEVRSGVEVSAAFVATTRERAPSARGRLDVQVLTPDGAPCERATVFVRRLIDGIPAPRSTQAAPRAPGHYEVELDAEGIWRVEAGHPDWVWNTVAVRFENAEDPKPLQTKLTLRRGATIEVRTAGASKGAPPAVLRARIVGDADEEMGLAGQSSFWRNVTTDAEGRALLRGLAARRWQIDVSGNDAWQYRLKVGDESPASHVEIDLSEGDVAKVEVVPERASAIRVGLQCEDGSAVDGDVRLRAYRVDRPGAEPKDFHAGTPFDLVAPMTFGPLDPGPWRLEFEPRRFARTTWAPGTEIPADAQTYTLEADGIPKDLGTIRVDCAPAARVAVYVDPAGAEPDDVPSPDLRLARLDGRWRENDEAPWQPLRGLSVAASKDALYVHRLPEGAGTMELTIKHPHLLDEPHAVATLRGERYRGGLHQAVAEVPGVGGAIVYSGARRLKLVPRPEGAHPGALRRPSGNGGFEARSAPDSPPVPADLEPRIVPIDPEWGAAVSVAPGVYDVRACGEPDPECERVEKLWSGIRVLAGSTIELR